MTLSVHKFRVGERVRLMSDALNRHSGIYEVLALLPVEAQGPQYRIKHAENEQQRITIEASLEECEQPKRASRRSKQ
jgi:hypothetical protein